MSQKYIGLAFHAFLDIQAPANDSGHTLGKPVKTWLPFGVRPPPKTVWWDKQKKSAHTQFLNFLDVGVFLALLEGFKVDVAHPHSEISS